MSAVKVWNGTAWVDKTAGVKYWNGTAWVAKPLKYWNGTGWTTVSSGSSGISFVGSNPQGTTGATTITPSVASVAAGDVAYVFWSFDRAITPSADPPTNWTLIANSQGSGSTQPGTRVYRRVYGASGTASVNLTHGTAVKHAAVMVVYRGVNNTTPEDVSITIDNTHAAQTTHNPPPVTGSTAGFVVVTAILERASSGDTAWTAPTGYTKRDDTLATATGSGGAIVAVADLLTAQSAGATVTPGDWTGNASFSQIVTYTLALRPA